MKFFKITLNTVGLDNEKVIFSIPPADELDENGNPAYDEDFLLSNAEYKDYIKATKAAVVSVEYILYEASDTIRLNYDELLSNEDKFFKIEQNDYLIEVKKAKAKGNGRKSPTALYIILGVAVVLVIAMLAYSGLKNGAEDGATSDTNITSGETVDTYSTEITETAESTEKVDTYITTSKTEIPEANENPAPMMTVSTDISAPAPTGTSAVFTLTFDKNGGVGTISSKEYAENTVVVLPFTGISKIGHTLMGWATAPDEPYTLYDNDTSRYVMPSNPATLYAVWTAAEFEVVYNYQIDGNAVTSKDRCKYGEVIQLMDISAVSSGNGEFVGWGLMPDAEEPVQSLTMPDGGIELYGIYREVTGEIGTTSV